MMVKVIFEVLLVPNKQVYRIRVNYVVQYREYVWKAGNGVRQTEIRKREWQRLGSWRKDEIGESVLETIDARKGGSKTEENN